MNQIAFIDHKETRYWISITLIDARYGYQNIKEQTPSNSDEARYLSRRFARTLYGSNIRSFDFSTSLLNPLMSAKLVFSDAENKQMINTYNNLNLYCSVQIQSEPLVDGVNTDTGITKRSFADQDHYFDETFYVNNLRVTERIDSVITYELDLISTLFFPFMQTGAVSTYAKDSLGYTSTKSLRSLLSKIFGGFSDNTTKRIKFVENSLSLKAEIVTTTDTPILEKEIEYISNSGETVFDSLKSILEKSMDRPDDDFICIPYDHIAGQHEIWFRSVWNENYSAKNPISDPNKYRNVLRIPNEHNRNYDNLQNDVEIIKTDSVNDNKDVIKNLFSSVSHSYDYESRQFSVDTDSLPTEYIQSSLNEFKPRLGKFSFDSEMMSNNGNNRTVEAIDSDGLNFYERTKQSLILNNFVIVETTGHLSRKPGIDMFLQTEVLQPSSLEDFNQRFLVTKVIHSFNLANQTYNNTMTMSNNDLRDDFEERLT
jgi:hypothetical protein